MQHIYNAASGSQDDFGDSFHSTTSIEKNVCRAVHKVKHRLYHLNLRAQHNNAYVRSEMSEVSGFRQV